MLTFRDGETLKLAKDGDWKVAGDLEIHTFALDQGGPVVLLDGDVRSVQWQFVGGNREVFWPKLMIRAREEAKRRLRDLSAKAAKGE